MKVRQKIIICESKTFQLVGIHNQIKDKDKRLWTSNCAVHQQECWSWTQTMYTIPLSYGNQWTTNTKKRHLGPSCWSIL